ncbi:hypothetical protein ACA910_001899 [Epithemia clementina (nom. ined.)]
MIFPFSFGRSLLLLGLIASSCTVSCDSTKATATTLKWAIQGLGAAPFLGQHTGVAVADLNNDGALDVLVAAGRHWIDQPYVLMNLGSYDDNREQSSNNVNTKTISKSSASSQPFHQGFPTVLFSAPLPLGDPGGYYQVDVTDRLSPFLVGTSDKNSSISNAHAVLLVGGTCHVTKKPLFPGWNISACTRGQNFPAVVLQVSVAGCSVATPDVPCDLQWKEIWRDPNPQGDRNGGFAQSPYLVNSVLGDGTLVDSVESVSSAAEVSTSGGAPPPAVVLVGQGGVAVYPLVAGDPLSFATTPSFTQPPPEFRDDQVDPRSDLPRYAAWAVATTSFGRKPLPNQRPLLVLGPRSDYNTPPNPIRVLVEELDRWNSSSTKNGDDDAKASIITIFLGGEAYTGNPWYALQPTGLKLADLDGDGIDDLVEANFLYRDQLADGFPVPQRVHLSSSSSSLSASTNSDHRTPWPTTQTLLLLPEGGRTLAVGQIYDDSPWPDLAFATADGQIILFANLGRDNNINGTFLGFDQRDTLHMGQDCPIRDVAIVPGLLTRPLYYGCNESKSNSSPTTSVSIVCAVTCGANPDSFRPNNRQPNSSSVDNHSLLNISGNVIFHGFYHIESGGNFQCASSSSSSSNQNLQGIANEGRNERAHKPYYHALFAVLLLGLLGGSLVMAWKFGSRSASDYYSRVRTRTDDVGVVVEQPRTVDQSENA